MSSKAQRNRLCQEIGHAWDSSTQVVTDYRRCTRSGCRTAEHLVRGRWVAATTHAQSSHQQQQSVMQPMLFAPGRDIPDRDEERRAELALLRLLGR